jgi:hypothetical protein
VKFPFCARDDANLEEESDAGPGECSMDWIILDRCVSDLLEDIDPLNYLTKQVHKDDCLSTLSGISPSFSDALLP